MKIKKLIEKLKEMDENRTVLVMINYGVYETIKECMFDTEDKGFLYILKCEEDETIDEDETIQEAEQGSLF